MINMNFKSLKIQLASPEKILSWSYGEVLKPETINYRTQRPEKDGLFSERIFGPTKDFECYCGKYKRIRYKGLKCDKCGVEVTKSSVRRERMGHINLASPVVHIWFLRSIPSRIGLFINAPIQKLTKVIYYAAYIVTFVNEEKKKEYFEEIDKEFKSKKKAIEKGKLKDLEEATIIAKENLKALEVGKILTETEYNLLVRKFAGVFKASNGAEAIRNILAAIDLEKEAERVEKEAKNVKDAGKSRKLLYKLKVIKSFIKNKMRPEWMIMTVLPVLPPDLRPMVPLDGGRYATSDLNDLYRRVINRNDRLKKLLEIKAPEIIVTNEKRMLQEAVDALIDNSSRLGSQQQLSASRRPLKSLADILKGKEGRFRQNLLGKRVDYSGRSVIVVGPDLKLNECGLPKKMALELFKPFVSSKIIERGMAHNIRNANRLIEAATPEIWEILEEVIKDKKVLLNRAPTLHRLGIQAFKPVLIEDLAIRIPPMVCSAFNADFDGDQMAVHLPLSEEAQKEATEKMLASGNILKPSTGDPIAQPTQDVVLGCYYLTKIKPIGAQNIKIFSSQEEALMAFHFEIIEINELIKVCLPEMGIVETSAGRLIFNGVLPKDFGFINKQMNKKELGKLLSALIDKYGVKNIWMILDEIKLLGNKYATISGVSWGMDDLTVPQEKKKIVEAAEKEEKIIKEQYEEGLLTDSERHSRATAIWDKTKEEVAKVVPKTLDPLSSVFTIIDSGSRGSWSQPIQMMGMKGLVQNPQGETIELPIKSSYKEGLSVLEFFINTHGARKGLTDTALKTAQAGYLTRRLVDVSQDLVIRENDCKTTKGITMFRSDSDEYGVPFSQRIFGRTALSDIKSGNKIFVEAGEIIGRNKAEEIEKAKIESIEARSPMTCKSTNGICSKCYGFDLSKIQPIELGEAVGVIAAQSIGEPGTQLTLRTFHTGGVAGVDITHGLQRIQELFEVRVPKGKAALAENDGSIEEIEDNKSIKIIKLKTLKSSAKGAKSKIIEYPVPKGAMIFVKSDDKILKGDQLCEGSIDLHELFDLKGKEAVERYLINEIQKIYASEGSAINDKHIEMIVRQMFSRLMVTEAGATNFVPGEVVEKSDFLENNRLMKGNGKQPAVAKQLLMGITRISLSTKSFLSAVSFQETARVLVGAAVEGKEDALKGLKENVIIGRLIPAGTGLNAKDEALKEPTSEI
ncbi:DNA-directed RNA polymerase subunit beta' [Candidatus Wolfebacteria bacterium]|nr:DNA-directed RNA polymerase subunit beta' [Candidatus Wolfebacteria bacterium]